MEPDNDRFKRIHCAWYHFALIANECDIPEIREGVRKSKIFYRPWSLNKRLETDEWWDLHKHLF